MRNRILNPLSYEETLRDLSDYHKIVISEICQEFKFPNVSTNKFIALRKNVEIGFLSSNLSDWEREAVFKYGKKHVFQEYYPIILDLIRKKTIPRKGEDYACNIAYFHAFSPRYHKNMIYSFFINYFEKPIFKNFNTQQNLLEQEIVVQISTFFRKKNKYGPEHISVSLLDEQFITIIVSGLLTPFLNEFIRSNDKEALFIEKIFALQAENVLEEIFDKYFNEKPYEPFIYFDKANDKIVILSSISKDKWMNFLDKMYV